LTDFTFHAGGCWRGSWDGSGRIKAGNLENVISVDPSMGGAGTGTNPDELLLSALSSCYMITLGIRLHKENIVYDHISIQSEGSVTKKGGLHFESVTHRPIICLSGQITDHLRERLSFCIRQAEKDCMIAKAVHGNVRIDVAPRFETVTG
jgi:peroxiredoxin-like protein